MCERLRKWPHISPLPLSLWLYHPTLTLGKLGLVTCFGQWDINKWHKQRLEKHLLIVGTCPSLAALGKPEAINMWMSLDRLHISITPGDFKSTIRYVSKAVLDQPILAEQPIGPDQNNCPVNPQNLEKK